MRAVLGIDAAWTTKQPSGVALVAENEEGWRLVAVSPSYEYFQAHGQNQLSPLMPPRGSEPDIAALLASARAICDLPIALVAVDMPLASSKITRRRFSDDKVSRAYGARKCGTHTPSCERPGKISTELQEGFRQAGYPLQTDTLSTPGLIEVYPHPALLSSHWRGRTSEIQSR